MKVELVYCREPHECDVVALELPAGATLGEALLLSGLLARHGLDPAALRVGIWGRMQELHTVLRERDRVEIYRPLLVDPKEARRLRYKRTKKAAAG
jgi:uncharacterized protein